MASQAYRTEHDSMGEVRVPADRYWGAQTERSRNNFPIGAGREPMPEEIIRADGVDAFRRIETEALKHILRDGNRRNTVTGLVLATGGGIVEREENRELLRENGFVIYLRRNTAELPKDNRPVSQADGLDAIYERRHERYEHWCDVEIANQEPHEAADQYEVTIKVK